MKKQLLLALLLAVCSLAAVAQGYTLDKEKTNETKLSALCDNELFTLRNEIYARQGYTFANESLQKYFSSESWYKQAANNADVKLNDIETYNVNLIKSIESKRQAKYGTIKAYFSTMKQAFATNDKPYLNDLATQMKKYTSYDVDLISNLQEVLNNVHPNDIHYYRNKGVSKTEVDNGFVVMVYTLYVEGKDITLRYSYQRHSDIIDGFGECTDYMSEDEFAIFWNFKIDANNTITLEGIEMAG